MSSVSDPLLPVQTSAMHDANIDDSDPAQSERARERRFRWVRLGVLATAAAMGPILLILLHMAAKDHARNESCCSWTGSSTCPFPAMPPVLVTGGRQPVNISSGAYTASMHATPGQSTSTALLLDLGHELPWLQDRAAKLTHAWGFGSGLQFVQIAEQGDSLQSVIENASAYSKAVVVGVIGGSAPVRRSAEQPYMSIAGEGAGDLAECLPVSAINNAAGVLEVALKRRLVPISIETAVFDKAAGSPPFAVYDVSSGRVTLDSGVVRQMHKLTALPEGLASFADSMFGQMARFAGIGERPGLTTVAEVVMRAAVAAIGIAFAYQVPLWFCVVCPAVLGLLAPLVINGGLGALANAACQHWQLPPDSCNDLWYGAFAAGMVLSLASAVPIVFICRLPQCARRH